MSSSSIDNKDNEIIEVDFKTYQYFDFLLADAVIPFSDLFKVSKNQDIYKGNEKIPFKKRHPLFKAIMKIEFEDVIKELSKKQKSK